MSRYRYEVNEQNEIRCWDDGNPNENNAPFFYQPTWPDNTPWANREEAELWAKRFIEMKEDFRKGRPGGSPSEPFIPWTEEDEDIYQKRLSGESVEE